MDKTTGSRGFIIRRTETHILRSGINDYDNLLSQEQKKYINLQLQILKKQFPDGIDIVLLEEVKGYDSISNYLRDFLSVNYHKYKCCGLIIFVIKNSNYVQLTAYSVPKKTYYRIIPYKNEIIKSIKNGIKIDDLYTGITTALNILIKKFKISKRSPEPITLKKSKDSKSAAKTIQNNFDKFIFISKKTSIWLAGITLILTLIIMFFKRISVSRLVPPPDIPRTTQFGIDLLYFSLLLFVISSIFLLFVITYEHAVLRFFYIIIILMAFRIVISRISKGKNWARIIITIFFIINFVTVLPPFITIIRLQPIGIIIVRIAEWVSELTALILLYMPATNNWFKHKKLLKKKASRKK